MEGLLSIGRSSVKEMRVELSVLFTLFGEFLVDGVGCDRGDSGAYDNAEGGSGAEVSAEAETAQRRRRQRRRRRRDLGADTARRGHATCFLFLIRQ